MINTYDVHISRPPGFKQLAVKDMLFVYYKCPQVEKYAKLFAHYNQIAYTLCGKKTIYHSGKSWVLTDDTSVLIRRTAYKQEMDHSVGWEVLAFFFQDNFLRQVFDEFRHHLPVEKLPPPPKDMLIEIRVSEATKAFFYSILPYFNQSSPPPASLLELKFKELLFNIISDPANRNVLAYIKSVNEQLKTPVWEVMEANYMFNLSIPDFARLAQQSVATFKREFHDYYHTSPGQWITSKRLEFAKILLETSQKSIGEICLDVGFENISHFSRIFKEKFAVSPIQYRKNTLISA